ncbi:sn-glycerol-3-phosphate import ATP-binding protein UgpC [Castellaniella defragrans]|jgi:sn-glycerol 3-phosphate transport system ATP-binding protein|uniref:sn-glycerol 3-phosphate transport system ATP-binding protein n=3 Tax=Castellaniella defragrans TaxID=75697 RepID=A0A7W9TQD5_CASDE|nr:sn-glycerol-3-phosphate import ATP-binding protein UgpC [Castellaniella defragrans]MBB6084779.1 sn-glycerol 3-phosphate transport system ATP-binding protein [Castellaniella defragrans]
MATLSFRDVRKTYPGGVAVIHGIDMEVRDGEFVVIVGPSGCGKSTLMRMVAGLESVTGGEIAIGGRVVNALEPAERDIAMVFQNYALYPHMSVFDNMAYGLKIRRLARDEIRRRVEDAARILELDQLLDRRPRQLSGGQRQRVAMGRAIVREPAVFLFDEPLSNLDAKLRVQMRLEIQKLHRRLGTTSLYVTHDQVEAMTLAHRMVVMNKGVPEQIGTPAEVFERPATVFVAGFIGSPPMNLLRVEVDAQGRVAGPDGAALPLAAPAAAARALVLGLRPEHLVLGAPGLRARVEMVEILGSEQLIHARWGEQPLVLRCAVSETRQRPPAAGDEITAGPDGEHPAHWFDAETGKRVGD